MIAPRGAFRLAGLGCFLLLVTACGERAARTPDTSWALEQPAAAPGGADIAPTHTALAGRVFEGHFEHTERALQGSGATEDGPIHRATWTLAQQVIDTHEDGAPAHSRLTVHLQREGDPAPRLLTLEPLQVAHPVARGTGARFAWPTPAPKLLRALLEGMDLAGFAGTRPWLPARPIRLGTPIDVAQHVPLPAPREGNEATLGLAERQGYVVAERAEREGAPPIATQELLLRLETRTVQEGVVEQEGDRGHLRVTLRVRGKAWLDLRTGMPRSVDIDARRRIELNGEELAVHQRTLKGTIREKE